MALNNSQYDAIMREYSRKQAAHRHLLEERRASLIREFPKLKEIDDEVASESVRCGKRILEGDTQALASLKKRIAALGREREILLRASGHGSHYLDMTWDCPDCRDTGYINGQKCHCFQQAQIDLLYTQSNLKDMLKSENFSSFSLDWYSSAVKEKPGGVSSRERAKHVYSVCRRFVSDFDTQFSNLFFYGDTGVGKTFLSRCIAKELLDTVHSVVYYSAQELFEALADRRFGRAEDGGTIADAISGCDLLIIDDLGTELTNSFVNSELFLCVNERLSARRSTIISTNLPLKAFSDTYSERIFSRITDSYTMLKLFGEDIRLQKKMKQNLAKSLE